MESAARGSHVEPRAPWVWRCPGGEEESDSCVSSTYCPRRPGSMELLVRISMGCGACIFFQGWAKRFLGWPRSASSQAVSRPHAGWQQASEAISRAADGLWNRAFWEFEKIMPGVSNRIRLFGVTGVSPYNPTLRGTFREGGEEGHWEGSLGWWAREPVSAGPPPRGTQSHNECLAMGPRRQRDYDSEFPEHCLLSGRGAIFEHLCLDPWPLRKRKRKKKKNFSTNYC